jgi:dimeric dUTPase (all-alpha-NTP-PPase superfamily)
MGLFISQQEAAIFEFKWSRMYEHLHEHFYPERIDKSQTFAEWLNENVKIEYFSPAMVVRTGDYAGDPQKVRYWALMADGDNCEIDEPDWLDPLHYLTSEDWKKRETDLDHY